MEKLLTLRKGFTTHRICHKTSSKPYTLLNSISFAPAYLETLAGTKWTKLTLAAGNPTARHHDWIQVYTPEKKTGRFFPPKSEVSFQRRKTTLVFHFQAPVSGCLPVDLVNYCIYDEFCGCASNQKDPTAGGKNSKTSSNSRFH